MAGRGSKRLKEQSWARSQKNFLCINPFQTMQNTKGKEQNSTEKSGEEYMTLKFKHVLVEMRGTAGLSEPSTSSSSRTSEKNMEQERSVEEDKVLLSTGEHTLQQPPKTRRRYPCLHYPVNYHHSTCFTKTLCGPSAIS